MNLNFQPINTDLLRAMHPIGVVGGMGSFATANFLQILALHNNVPCDQSHVPYITLSLPQIDDRSEAILSGSDLPMRQIIERAVWLQNVGCGAIVIPCNTAHFWADTFAKVLHIDFINIVDVTRKIISHKRAAKNGDFHVICLGTQATMNQNLYPKTDIKLFAKDHEIFESKLCAQITEIIDNVKQGKLKKAEKRFVKFIDEIRKLNPDIIILGCSELSAISGTFNNDNDIIDPIQNLADACIYWWQQKRKIASK